MQFSTEEKLDISIVMPCLNEEKTIGACVDEALGYIFANNLNGEVIVSDNGSQDNSAVIAKEHGARVVYANVKGYGSAIMEGIRYSSGKVIIMGDCDTTYDFSRLDGLYRPIFEGKCDVVIGDRFAGGIEKGAMPLSHKIGVRFLSAFGRARYKVKVKDFHSGLRAISRSAALKMECKTTGMEFATEMIAMAARNGNTIMSIPIVLRKCRYDRSSKLRTIPDGLRHLKYIIGFNKGHQ